jgi:outer membrane beta-barrel protein
MIKNDLFQKHLSLLVLLSLGSLFPTDVHAEDAKGTRSSPSLAPQPVAPQPAALPTSSVAIPPQATTTGATAIPRSRPVRELDVKAVKEKYWAKGEEAELEVVQNRTFKKKGRVRIEGFFGGMATDPFLSVKTAGGSLGYFFSENWSFQFTGWKSLVTGSDALKTLESRGYATLLNRPKSYYAGEMVFSPLYGKLSLLGSSIIYFDLYALAGLGMTSTQTGNYLTPDLGIGQQIYLSKSVAVCLEFRLFRYRENLVPSTSGAGVQVADSSISSRSNLSSVASLGLALHL